MADAEEDYRDLLRSLEAEFPRFRVVRKDDAPLQRVLHLALALATLGSQRRYLYDFVTTLGARVYVPADWDSRPPDERICTLRHERVHLRQFRRHGWLAMSLLYLFVPLPVGLAYFRMRFERAAYEESIRAAWERLGPAHVLEPAYRRRMVALLTGGAYGWMWPFRRSTERWFDGFIATLATHDR